MKRMLTGDLLFAAGVSNDGDALFCATQNATPSRATP